MMPTNKAGENPQRTSAISGVSRQEAVEFGHMLGFTITGIFLVNKKPMYAAPHLTSILIKEGDR